MKICYLCADRGISLTKHNGASAHFRSLVRAFAALGHDLMVITASQEGGQELEVPVVAIPAPETLDWLFADTEPTRDRKERALKRERKRVVHALGHIWNNVMAEQVLQEVVPRFRPDVLFEVYSPFGAAGGIMAKRLGVRHVLNVHASLAWEGAAYRRQALQDAAELLEYAAFESASLIVTVSHELRHQLLTAGVRASKIEVIPNGVDVDLFAPEGPTYRNGLDSKVVVGFVGSLKAWHGVDVLAEAFKILASDPRLHLLVVGDGPMAGLLRDLEYELPGQVTVVGAVHPAEVPSFIRAMDVAVAPYPPQERFYFSPLKVLEYMATGRAVVASRIGQLAELIRDANTGLLVPPGDAAALAGAVRRLATDESLRRRLGAQAAVEARHAHTWAQRASEIVDLVQNVH